MYSFTAEKKKLSDRLEVRQKKFKIKAQKFHLRWLKKNHPKLYERKVNAVPSGRMASQSVHHGETGSLDKGKAARTEPVKSVQSTKPTVKSKVKHKVGRKPKPLIKHSYKKTRINEFKKNLHYLDHIQKIRDNHPDASKQKLAKMIKAYKRRHEYNITHRKHHALYEDDWNYRHHKYNYNYKNKK